LLTGIFFFQDSLVKRPLLFSRLRTGFLVFTLFWLGWYATAQISVVNILTFTEALRTDFRWDYFLMDPLVFILWFSVAASMLFWGRGAFCGWLCPFGALQELSNRAARALRVPQIRVPFGLHQRLWPIKYMRLFQKYFMQPTQFIDWQCIRKASRKPYRKYATDLSSPS
jgi:NosR/NirI family nitrous oxide reductase transcriptional regulator